MSDTFYMRQAAYNKTAKKLSKTDMAKALGMPILERLLVKDLERLTAASFNKNLKVPQGRLKAPYVEECKKINDKVDWSKLTVAVMKEVINDCVRLYERNRASNQG